MTFDYKKYSLENLEKWIEDAINSSEASPQEIFDVIKNVVRDNYYCYKNHTERCYELLALLNDTNNLQEQVKSQEKLWDKEDVEAILREREYYEGVDNILSCDKDDPSSECQKSWNDFWEEVDEKHSREYNLREAEYYNKRAKLDAEYEAIKAEGGYEWTPEVKKDKVKKWVLPVEECKDADTDETEYFVSFPDDLLEAANLKEGDQVEWIDQGNGSYLLKKV